MRRNLRRSTDKRRQYNATPLTRVILGVDPGTLITGYGVVAKDERGTLRLIASGTIRNSSKMAIPTRLHTIHRGLLEIIGKYHPSEFAIESSFYGKNAQSALKLGQARGVSLLAAVVSSLPCFEYTPREVKKSVVGTGAAGKQQVQYMVRSLLQLDTRPLLLDASDAIAVALCHVNRNFAQREESPRSWKGFVDSHPERVVK